MPSVECVFILCCYFYASLCSPLKCFLHSLSYPLYSLSFSLFVFIIFLPFLLCVYIFLSHFLVFFLSFFILLCFFIILLFNVSCLLPFPPIFVSFPFLLTFSPSIHPSLLSISFAFYFPIHLPPFPIFSPFPFLLIRILPPLSSSPFILLSLFPSFYVYLFHSSPLSLFSPVPSASFSIIFPFSILYCLPFHLYPFLCSITCSFSFLFHLFSLLFLALHYLHPTSPCLSFPFPASIFALPSIFLLL